MRYYINGVRQKNRVLHLKDGTYYVDKNGNRAYGWKTINGNCYFFDKRNDGKASVGWLTRPSGVFCFNANGIRYENTQLISTSGKIYIIGSDGKRCSGWTNYRGERYYINNVGLNVKIKSLPGMVGKKWKKIKMRFKRIVATVYIY